ncbi:MAG: hypothetical protein Q7R79_02090 [bacterium]|nr:hypothetical protein [bacterium]
MQIQKEIFQLKDSYKESGSPAKKFWLNIWTWWAGVTVTFVFWDIIYSFTYGMTFLPSIVVDFVDRLFYIVRPFNSLSEWLLYDMFGYDKYSNVFEAWIVFIVFIILMILAHRIGKRIKDTILRIGFNLIILFALRILFILIVCGKIYSTFCQ